MHFKISSPVTLGKSLSIGKLLSSWWQIWVFQNSNFSLIVPILLLATNTEKHSFFPLELRGPLVHFQENVLKYQCPNNHCLSVSQTSSNQSWQVCKLVFHENGHQVSSHLSHTRQPLYFSTRHTYFMCAYPISSHKILKMHIFKHQDLTKLITLTSSSRTFLWSWQLFLPWMHEKDNDYKQSLVPLPWLVLTGWWFYLPLL